MGPGFESADLLTTKMNKTLENIEVGGILHCMTSFLKGLVINQVIWDHLCEIAQLQRILNEEAEY